MKGKMRWLLLTAGVLFLFALPSAAQMEKGLVELSPWSVPVAAFGYSAEGRLQDRPVSVLLQQQLGRAVPARLWPGEQAEQRKHPYQLVFGPTSSTTGTSTGVAFRGSDSVN